MRVRLWGVRGSYPTPLTTPALQDKLRALLREATPADLASAQTIDALISRSPHARTWGGNTSCIEVEIDGQICIFDAGSGIANLSRRIMAAKQHASHGLHLFFTHFHWDHICGFPFFAPIYVPGTEVNLYSGRDDLQRILAVQMNDAHFPAKWDKLPSRIRCHHLDPARPHAVAGGTVKLLRLEHPDGAFGYRFEHGGRSVCYLTDTEISKNPDRWMAEYCAFVEGADLVIVDACYGFLAFHEHINWGHSTIFTWIDFFRTSTIGELVIFHHDPLADDAALGSLLDNARRYRELIAPEATWKLSAAFEGQDWSLDAVAPA